MGFANNMSSGFTKVFFESGFKNFPSRQIFGKKGVKPLKCVCDHFWKIIELNSEMLEPSLLPETGN